jgi:hypothetical protein
VPPEDNANAATGGDATNDAATSTSSTGTTDANSAGTDSAGYPANTPVAEMSTAQQAAYWKAQSRKHEQRVKSLGTPDEIKKLRDDAAELDKLRQASMGEQERAVSAARTEAASETAREWAKRLVRSELRAATAGRIEPNDLDELLAPMDLGWFLDENSNVDDAKVRTIAAKFATNGTGAAGNTGNGTRFPDLGQGKRETSARPGVAAGAAAYAARKGRTPAGQTTTSPPV